MIRRRIIVILLVFVLGGTSCSVMQRSSRNIYLPNRAEVTLMQLAESLSHELGMPLKYGEDDLGLYAFAADWIGTPYRYGSHSKRGTDCSGFVYELYKEVYRINISRTSSAELMRRSRRVTRDQLQEGDLVFFDINNRRGGRASHVGTYLKDDKFVHASTQSGVIISSLNDPYYRNSFLAGGRYKK